MTRPATAPIIAFAMGCVGIALFSGMDAIMKAQSIAIGAYSAMFWRSLLGSVLGGAIFFGGGGRLPGWRALRLHLIRGSFGALSIVLFFWGLTRVPLAQGIALAFISPLVAIGLAALVLKEQVGRAAIIGSVTAFAGVGVILIGQAQAEMGPDAFRGAIAILIAAMLYGASNVMLRVQAQSASPLEVAFATNFVFFLCYLAATPFVALMPMAGWGGTGWIAAAAVLALVSIQALAWAYARADASYLAPVEYTAFAWAALLGWLVFAEVVSPWTVAGASLIVAGCILAARSKTVKGVEAAI
ncbi:DMT family transporter [Sphingomonas sp. FW199]|uniref:DMT family transporter n=1 Tax=Sphingomonas sp. FW199 TaxID=3400217 RepID=UPI003CEC9765